MKTAQFWAVFFIFAASNCFGRRFDRLNDLRFLSRSKGRTYFKT
jgi:hypothetical protein